LLLGHQVLPDAAHLCPVSFSALLECFHALSEFCPVSLGLLLYGLSALLYGPGSLKEIVKIHDSL